MSDYGIHAMAVDFVRRLNRGIPVNWEILIYAPHSIEIMDDFMAYIPGSAQPELARSLISYFDSGSQKERLFAILEETCLLHKHRWINLGRCFASLPKLPPLSPQTAEWVSQIMFAHSIEKDEKWFLECSRLTIGNRKPQKISTLEDATGRLRRLLIEPEERKLSWHQLHLSTCIVLMFVAAPLVWANLAPRNLGPDKIEQGWPFSFYFSYWRFPTNGFGPPPDLPPGYDDISLMTNIVFCLAILAAVASACEWWVRRRDHAADDPA